MIRLRKKNTSNYTSLIFYEHAHAIVAPLFIPYLGRVIFREESRIVLAKGREGRKRERERERERERQAAKGICRVLSSRTSAKLVYSSPCLFSVARAQLLKFH